MKQFKNIFTLVTLLLISGKVTFAQEVAKANADSFALLTNPAFIILSSLIIVFIFVIYSIGQAIKTFADYRINEIKKENKNKVGKTLSILALVIISNASFAQETAKVVIENTDVMGLNEGLFYSMATILVVEIFVTIILLFTFTKLIKKETPEEVIAASKANEPSFLDQFNDAVAIEKEQDIMFDHEYDGIRELDNNLPPWWKYGFYLTIVFAFIYVGYYHFSGGKKLQIDEYNQQLVDAKSQMDEFRKKSANSVDENNVTLLTEKDALTKGKEDFDMNCSACHGKLGEGTVGPNLTDDYWLHGGSIKDVFKTIKLGYAEKGMKAWENDLSPLQIQQISSYIKSLRGTNPPNGKEKQGDLYNESGAANDSLTVVVDSSAAKIDSSAVAKK